MYFGMGKSCKVEMEHANYLLLFYNLGHPQVSLCLEKAENVLV